MRYSEEDPNDVYDPEEEDLLEQLEDVERKLGAAQREVDRLEALQQELTDRIANLHSDREYDEAQYRHDQKSMRDYDDY